MVVLFHHTVAYGFSNKRSYAEKNLLDIAVSIRSFGRSLGKYNELTFSTYETDSKF